MVDPVGMTFQTHTWLDTGSRPPAPSDGKQRAEPNDTHGQTGVDYEAVESQIALATLLLMNQELSRSRLQLEQRLREAHQEEV